jgi:hypothetical protein
LWLQNGSPALFQNEHGKLKDVTQETGIAGSTGQWTSIVAAIFDATAKWIMWWEIWD